MSEPMTREEMREAIQRVGVLLDGALDKRLKADAWRDIGTAQGMLANVLGALEAEPKPLAEAHCRLLKEAIGKPLSTIVGCLFDGPSQAESIAVHVIILEEAAP